MRHINFDLKFLLFATDVAAFLACGGVDEYDLLRLLLCVVLVATASSEYAISQGSSPYIFTAISCVLSVIVLGLLWGPVHAVIYLLRDGPNAAIIHEDFFEDGLEFPLIAIPMLLTCFFAIPAALIGLFCANIVSRVNRTIKRRK